MNDVCIHRCHTVHVYKMPYVIGMKQEKYRKCNMYRGVMKHENELKHGHEHERKYVMNT